MKSHKTKLRLFSTNGTTCPSPQRRAVFIAPRSRVSLKRETSIGETRLRSNNQHRVTVTVEPVLLLNRLPVSLGNELRPAKRLNQHQQRGAREMKVRHQGIDRTKFKRRANK